jgi:5-oxoprolinase (ATP-hydrolysing)
MGADAWHIWVDTGGTFTDCIAQSPDGSAYHQKVLSSSALRGRILDCHNPRKICIQHDWNAPDDFITGLRFKLLDHAHEAVKITSFDASSSTITLAEPVAAEIQENQTTFEIQSFEEAPILACRLVTGTLPGDDLPPIQLRLATTKGTNALLEKDGAPTLLLISKGFKDFLGIGDQKRNKLFSFNVQKPSPLHDKVIEIPERLDAKGQVLEKLTTENLSPEISDFLDQPGASVAISLMHSYQNGQHEQQLKDWLLDKGANYVSCSSEMSSLIKLLPRAQTTLVNAYLDPILQNYLDGVRSSLSGNNFYVLNSTAGLSSSKKFNPKDSLLSGPAGGVIGAASVGKASQKQHVISLDMGGTSTDVARYDGQFDYQFEHTVGDTTIKAPALSIETVAAGGGSICSFDGQKLTVGPGSAGADPGPACYGAGGPLTLTDVNLLLGRLQPKNFSIPISSDAAERKFQSLMQQIQESGESPSRDEVLMGLLRIANERMAEAINKISLRKGYDPNQYSLVAFGGAGAQHATAIASELDIDSVLVPAQAGLLSAKGLGHAAVEEFAERQILKQLDEVKPKIPTLFDELERRAKQKLQDQLQGIGKSVITRRRMVFMRLVGQESTLEIEFHSANQLFSDFKEAYQKRYGHWIDDRKIEIESFRLVAASKGDEHPNKQIDPAVEAAPVAYKTEVNFGKSKHTTPVYQRSDLKAGHSITGPAIVLDPYSTTIIEPEWEGSVEGNGTLALNRSEESSNTHSSNFSESINLELFTNRFTSIAEEMGEMMQRTALSVNIKERMDFSCALLNSQGELIVNAPHIPVHLGALGLCVRKLQSTIVMEEGDVIVTNHPAFGGSHLPDVTVITPIFDHDSQLLGYAACRAHHAEIGGTRPGSMPPNAKNLAEEGVVIPPMHLIKNGHPQWDQIKSVLQDAEYPSRAIAENMADLRAAVASNHQGVQALRQLAADEGSDKVQHFMKVLKKHAAQQSCAMLASLPDMSKYCEELLDDGSRLCAKIDKEGNQLDIDFTGSADVHPGNLNATPAIVKSVTMYLLRCLVDKPIPLNEGLLDPIDVTLPEGMLNPQFEADPKNCPAVVGGNTETSQRLVDLLLKPFERVACSQGTMNNVIFGNESFGYYETIGGGTGAGPDFEGADAVHHHMTNTAGTDPEILEHRYPVRLERYEIRKQSGGNGRNKGGNGITRELLFLEPVSLSVLTQHRRERPYGLQGGKPGKQGSQFVIRKDGNKHQLNPVDGIEIKAGDRFVIHTPGGGGFGKSDSND